MNRAIITVSVLSLALAGANAEIITFDELPVGSSLDGQTVDGITFTYLPNGSTKVEPRISDIPGSVNGIRDDITLRGNGTDDDYVIHIDFHGVVDDFGFSLTTAPFGFLSVIAADVVFYNDQGERAIEFSSFAATNFAGAYLPDGTPILKVGRSDTSLFRNNVFDAVSADIRIVGVNGIGNPSSWYMDNLVFNVVPSPGVCSVLAGAGLMVVRRRRR